MAKFAKPIDDDAPLPVGTTPTPASPIVIDVNNNNSSSGNNNSTTNFQAAQATAAAQAIASVGLAQTSIDKDVVDHQMEKEDEHWVKAYWRPAMGWLYMAINLMDFIVFPIICMILPVIYKGFGIQMAYAPWQSLTLSNGGMIHIAFGGILGVAAYTRGQEKIAKIGS